MENWYDIYGLSENRNVETIETFLRNFTDRKQIEDRKNEVITLIPNISTSERDKLFKPVYAYAYGSPHRDTPKIPKGLTDLTELETVTVDTLSQAIELGIFRTNQAFSLYLPSYTRENISRLIVHFTLDNQVVLGLSISERKDYDRYRRFQPLIMDDNPDQDNKQLAEKLRDEMAEVTPLKATAITLNQYAPDNEQEFMNMKIVYDRFLKSFRRNRTLGSYDYQEGIYYIKFRKHLHLQNREYQSEKRPAINLFDNFTVGDNQGQIVSVIKSHGDILRYERVQNPDWKDVVKLPYLGYLLREACSRGGEFQPKAILRVSIPLNSKVEYLWKGHRDGASDFTTFEGVKAAEVIVEETYRLDDMEDLKKLAEEGFFKNSDNFFHVSPTNAFKEWLKKYEQKEI